MTGVLTFISIVAGYVTGTFLFDYVLHLSHEGIHWPLITVVVALVVFFAWVFLF